jgi:hypothetical protein
VRRAEPCSSRPHEAEKLSLFLRELAFEVGEEVARFSHHRYSKGKGSGLHITANVGECLAQATMLE